MTRILRRTIDHNQSYQTSFCFLVDLTFQIEFRYARVLVADVQLKV